ncbi:hydroxyacid dehydrogenase [Candidatus Uhrbacteria bacterium CG10_big_fil_rev_8_21_14_0_10_48_11]|uniref:Hydroxyacid dehydrogenase n=1 Tax=Candidatus Uhrbacteria bacterium CG10_big_fil_rev_8_21_14_0_10_48_11 TaxID=1975037 RepID=A0A2M8LE05_9BACT|nr:MAG: hydroxyacid dehydrogenase [Candidatus Uhrbacteria bacterium CG10_big_fil_rev_8_21_14_0_10_48_11]
MAHTVGFIDLEGWEEERIRKEFPDEELFLAKKSLAEISDEDKAKLEVLSVFVSSKVTKEELLKMPALKFISTRSTGFDHLALAACKERGIIVSYVPGYGDHTVAEYAFGLLLSLTRKVYTALDRIKESGPFSPEELRGTDLSGKTIGIIGTGRIGMVSVNIALGFDMRVLAYDPYPKEETAAELGYRYVSLDELLANSDVVTLHAPYSEATHHLLNAKNLKQIKRGVFIVNTARGGLIETDALVTALQDGTVAGAALDVLEGEGEIGDETALLRHADADPEAVKLALENRVLITMPNVLVSPHNAFNSQEAMERIMDVTYGNLRAFLAGKPEHVVPQQ